MKQFACLLMGMLASSSLLSGQEVNSLQSADSREARKSVSLKLADTRPFDSKDNARITLDVQFDYGDGTGFQVLLDSDATAYGTVIPQTGELVNGEVPEGLYDNFEYKIPVNATAVFNDYTVLRKGESQTIEVSAGLYDYAVVNPYDPWTTYFAGGASRGDDVAFAAGVEYVFVIEESGGMDNCVLNVLENHDLAIKAITAPATAEDLTGMEEVTVVVENRGKNNVDSYNLSYRIGENAVVTETVDEVLAAGDTLSYTFATKADLSQPGVFYSLTVFVECENDVVSTNDTMTTEIFHIGPIPSPFVCDFEEEADMFWWNATDADEDGVFWKWSMRGRAEIRFAMDNPLDDYLTTLCPVHLEAGNAYIAFEYDAMDESCVEALALLYGTSKDPAQMETILEVNPLVKGPDGLHYGLVVLDIEEPGDYYFAFHAFSDPDMFGLWIDNVEIGQGIYEGKPDLSIKEVILPLSGCGLSAESLVQAHVANRGRTDIAAYELSYAVGDVTKSMIFHDLPEGADTVVVFTDESLDLSEYGTYTVRVEGRVLETGSGKKEENLLDNAAEARVANFEPLAPPFVTDFSDTLQRADWLDDSYWTWNEVWAAYGGRTGMPLVSRCVSLEEGTGYRFSMRYRAGIDLFGLQVPEDFVVLCGPTGTDIANWDTLWSEQCYEESFVTEDVSFVCENSGDYGFAIVSSGYLWIQETSLEEVDAYDARLESFPAPFPRLIPEEQVNASQMASVGIRNRGFESIDVLVEIWQGNAVLGQDTVALNGLDDYGIAEVPFTLSGKQPGGTVALAARASIIGKEDADSTLDNEMLQVSFVTKDEMAYDAVTEDMYADSSHCIGSDGNLACGLPFKLTVKDTLTHIAVGWGYPSGESVVLTVHEWDPESGFLGELVYEETVSAGKESGIVRYEIEPLLLEPGYYMVSEQTTGYILLADATEEGFLYATSMVPPLLQYGVGYPAIRLVFGSDAVLPYVDAEAVDIISPVQDGVFSSEEEVVVRVRNNGSDAAMVTVGLNVNGRNTGSQDIEIASKAIKDLSFAVDMSEPMEYELTAFVSVSGDMNRGNDTVTRVVKSMVGNGNQEVDSRIIVFPNPSDGLFTVELTEAARIEVYDMTGKKLHQEECAFAGCHEVDLRGKASGMLVLRVIFENGLVTQRIIVG